MTIDTEKFISYAAHNIANSKIAAAFGITEGRVSQLLANEKVQDLVARKKQEIVAEEIEDQSNIKSTASRLLRHIGNLIESTESLGEATRAYEILSRMKEPNQGPRRDDSPILVSLELPDFIKTKLSIEFNSKKEIVEIDGRNMATLSTHGTHQLIKANHNAKAEQRDERANVRTLSSSTETDSNS